ncbi:MAG: FAD binding domain-containing protein [Anaerolineales bacterium]
MSFDYHQPGTLEGAIELLERHGRQAALLAGGTALMIDIQHGEVSPQHLVSLWGLPDLRQVRLSHRIVIGALATMTDLAGAIRGAPELAGLWEAARSVGGRQIQNMATIGGNICKASPGADSVPPLLCLDAELVLRGPMGERTTPLDGFLTGPDQTAMNPGELLTAIELPPVPPNSGTASVKIMRRKAVDCSIVAVSARVSLEADGDTCREARVGIAAAAPNPFRAKRAEATLAGQSLTDECIAAAARLAQQESSPIDDVRASAEYRRMLVETLVKQAIATARARAAQSAAG